MVVDDLMTSPGYSKQISKLFTQEAHHKNLTEIFTVQNLVKQVQEMITISHNARYLVLHNNPRDKSPIRYLAHKIFRENSKFLTKVYEHSREDPLISSDRS